MIKWCNRAWTDDEFYFESYNLVNFWENINSYNEEYLKDNYFLDMGFIQRIEINRELSTAWSKNLLMQEWNEDAKSWRFSTLFFLNVINLIFYSYRFV